MDYNWLIALAVFIVIFFLKGIKIVKEYERAIIYRLGKLRSSKPSGPGLFYAIPCIDTFVVFELRTQIAKIPNSEVLTKDSLTLNIDGVIFFRIIGKIQYVLIYVTLLQ